MSCSKQLEKFRTYLMANSSGISDEIVENIVVFLSQPTDNSLNNEILHQLLENAKTAEDYDRLIFAIGFYMNPTYEGNEWVKQHLLLDPDLVESSTSALKQLFPKHDIALHLLRKQLLAVNMPEADDCLKKMLMRDPDWSYKNALETVNALHAKGAMTEEEAFDHLKPSLEALVSNPDGGGIAFWKSILTDPDVDDPKKRAIHAKTVLSVFLRKPPFDKMPDAWVNGSAFPFLLKTSWGQFDPWNVLNEINKNPGWLSEPLSPSTLRPIAQMAATLPLKHTHNPSVSKLINVLADKVMSQADEMVHHAPPDSYDKVGEYFLFLLAMRSVREGNPAALTFLHNRWLNRSPEERAACGENIGILAHEMMGLITPEKDPEFYEILKEFPA